MDTVKTTSRLVRKLDQLVSQFAKSSNPNYQCTQKLLTIPSIPSSVVVFDSLSRLNYSPLADLIVEGAEDLVSTLESYFDSGLQQFEEHFDKQLECLVGDTWLNDCPINSLGDSH